MNYKLEELLFSAIRASLKAGEEILKVYNSDFTVEHKDDKSPLTLADKNAHNAIAEILKSTGIPLLSEEGKSIDYAERCKWEYFWMVDPLDGTKEFIKRNGEFTVNIALIHKQKSILGVIYVPVTTTLYFAAENVGCYRSNIQHPASVIADLMELIHSSQKLPLATTNEKFTVVASRSHLSEETEMFIDGLKTIHKEVDFLSSGSSIKLCLVAEGSANVYPRFAPTMEWDTAAGQAICEIAGKKVVDFTTNQNLLYNKPNLLNNWFVVN
jgi:3'(2'), 5'-bisphosphate nucleotidase